MKASYHNTSAPQFQWLLLLFLLFSSVSYSVPQLYSITYGESKKSVKTKRSSLFGVINSEFPIIPVVQVDQVHTKKSSLIPFPTALLEKVENLTFFQSLLRNIAASKAREELADVSSTWANTAHKVVSSGYGEVIHLTRRSQEAQLLSLERAATAQLLTDAVSKANRVYQSSLSRYKTLEAAAATAEQNLKIISKALFLVLHIFSIRDKLAQEGRAKAFRLSTEYLQKVLDNLKATVEFAQNTHPVLVEMR